jgi:hypothetical protein
VSTSTREIRGEQSRRRADGSAQGAPGKQINYFFHHVGCWQLGKPWGKIIDKFSGQSPKIHLPAQTKAEYVCARTFKRINLMKAAAAHAFRL